MYFLLNFQERPLDVVVEGFTHLQQYHAMEISRGLAGMGTYRLRPGFPCVDNMPIHTMLSIQPDNIVKTLQEPSAEARLHILLYKFVYFFVSIHFSGPHTAVSPVNGVTFLWILLQCYEASITLLLFLNR